MRTLNVLHRTIPWIRNRRHTSSDYLGVVEEDFGDDQALNSSHFYVVDNGAVNDEKCWRS
jgi:hypothetical protein